MEVSACELDAESAPELTALYETYDPWADRPESEVRALVAESDEVLGLRTVEDDQLVASARVLTDYRRYGMIYDVVVHDEYRGNGLGRELMRTVVDHPRLQEVPLSLHARAELVPFYEDCGFHRFDGGVERDSGETVTYHWLRTEK